MISGAICGVLSSFRNSNIAMTMPDHFCRKMSEPVHFPYKSSCPEIGIKLYRYPIGVFSWHSSKIQVSLSSKVFSNTFGECRFPVTSLTYICEKKICDFAHFPRYSMYGTYIYLHLP